MIPTSANDFLRWVDAHDRRLRALAYQLLSGDAAAMDDVLQDAYLNAYRALPTFRRDADPGTWLYRIVYNACIDEIRRQRRRPEPVDPADHAHERPSSSPGPGERTATSDELLRVLRSLPIEQRIALVLVDGQGFDAETAGQALGIAASTVRSRLSRARAFARAHLISDQPDQESR